MEEQHDGSQVFDASDDEDSDDEEGEKAPAGSGIGADKDKPSAVLEKDIFGDSDRG